jgi:hypothetical protein
LDNTNIHLGYKWFGYFCFTSEPVILILHAIFTTSGLWMKYFAGKNSLDLVLVEILKMEAGVTQLY